MYAKNTLVYEIYMATQKVLKLEGNLAPCMNLPCKVWPVGEIWGSGSHPRTLSHVHRRSWGLNHQSCKCWITCSTNIDVPQDKLLQKHKCSMCQGTHTSTNTHAEPRVFLSVTYTIVTTEPCGLLASYRQRVPSVSCLPIQCGCWQWLNFIITFPWLKTSTTCLTSHWGNVWNEPSLCPNS